MISICTSTSSLICRQCSVDKVQIEQVLLNLLRNGIESISERGSDAERSIHVRAMLESPERLKVSIEDGGVGLNPNHVQRVFKPFYTTKREGMGMGLSISRSIIEAHGGRIWAEVVRLTRSRFSLHAAHQLERAA
jgi:two-component system sensor kinase FixL